MSADVDIEFDPPRKVGETELSYWLVAEGEPELQLPRKLTTLTLVETPEGSRASSARMPVFIAEDRGLLGETATTSEPEMSRLDWYTLGLSMSLIARGVELKDVPWEVGKMLKKLTSDGVNAVQPRAEE